MPSAPEQWKTEVNDRYRQIVDILLSLATGALVLPAIFLRTFLGVTAEEPVLIFLDWRAFLSMGLFAAVILLGLIFHYTSTKWVKTAWGQPTTLSSNAIERILDVCFVSMVIAFGTGMSLFVWFAMRG